MATTAFAPVMMACTSRSLASFRGSASRRLSICSVDRFLMLSTELMIAPTMRRPSVVGPTSTSSTRGEAAATVSKYLVIDGQSASFPSAPILKPKNASGVGTCAAAGSGAARTRHRTSTTLNKVLLRVIVFSLASSP
jgi:hypothetical protein